MVASKFLTCNSAKDARTQSAGVDYRGKQFPRELHAEALETTDVIKGVNKACGLPSLPSRRYSIS